MRAGALTADKVRRMLDVDDDMLFDLSCHDAFPWPGRDGAYDARLVFEACARRPWLRRLDTPMSDAELERIHPGLSVPLGVGFTLAGRRYARLSDVLRRRWGRMTGA